MGTPETPFSTPWADQASTGLWVGSLLFPWENELTRQILNNKTFENYDHFRKYIFIYVFMLFIQHSKCWKYIFQSGSNVKTDEPGILN